MMQSNIINENDSENLILQKRSLMESNMWISNLNFISEESNYLVKKLLDNPKSKVVKEKFLSLLDEKSEIQNKLISYRNSADNLIECIDLECDLQYHNEHEKVRRMYVAYLKNYRTLKLEILSSL